MGEFTKKGEYRPIDDDDFSVEERGRSMQAEHGVPVLQRVENRHEYLFLAMFDGTGQNANDPNQNLTNIGHLYRQTEIQARNPSNRIGYRYVEGIGTQDNPLSRLKDKIAADTWDEKIEEAYRALSEQTRKWQQQDPDAQVRVVGVGYSRGAVLSAGLSRLIDAYGIADPENLKFGRDGNGNITVQSDRPPLMAPGAVAQALGLYDPVATGFPKGYDARTPPSVISGLSLTANDEGRVDFAHQGILQAGLSQDRRFANLPMPGGHSNIGGGNRDAGLEALSFNRMADYLNGLRDPPLIQYRTLPAELSQYTVFQARGPSAIRGMDRDDIRDIRHELANCKVVDPCRDGEPIDEALASQFQYRTLQPTAPRPNLPGLQRSADPERADPLPAAPAGPERSLPTDPSHPDHGLLRKFEQEVRRFDEQAGKAWGDDSERLVAAALKMAKEHRFAPGDDLQLAFNAPTGKYAAGEILHLFRQGPSASPDPAANRAWMTTQDALSMSANDRFRQIEGIDQAQQLSRQQELQQLQERTTQARSAHAMA